MTFRRTWAMARKETLHIVRDPRALGVSIALPMLLLMLFGYALTLDVDHVPFVLWDQSGTAASRDLASKFTGSPYFTLAGAASDYGEIREALDHNRALMALVVPTDYGRDAAAGRSTQVQVIVDGSDANTATIVLNYAEAIVQAASRELGVRVAMARGLAPPADPVDLRARFWFNSDMVSMYFIVPGLIAVIMMLIAALLTSLTVAREWETGTMEQLISTPVRGTELVVGKLLPYVALGSLDMVLAVAAGRWLFDVPLRGSLLVLGLMSLVYLVGALSLGLLISIVTKSQLLASQVAFVATFLPAFLLSGFMFDISNLPPVLQAVTYAVPARYFIVLLRGVYLKGVGPGDLHLEGVFLLVFSVLMVGLSVLRFKKRLV
jgi:ABC-2 type transport system permease protein